MTRFIFLLASVLLHPALAAAQDVPRTAVMIFSQDKFDRELTAELKGKLYECSKIDLAEYEPPADATCSQQIEYFSHAPNRLGLRINAVAILCAWPEMAPRCRQLYGDAVPQNCPNDERYYLGHTMRYYTLGWSGGPQGSDKPFSPSDTSTVQNVCNLIGTNQMNSAPAPGTPVVQFSLDENSAEAQEAKQANSAIIEANREGTQLAVPPKEVTDRLAIFVQCMGTLRRNSIPGRPVIAIKFSCDVKREGDQIFWHVELRDDQDHRVASKTFSFAMSAGQESFAPDFITRQLVKEWEDEVAAQVGL